MKKCAWKDCEKEATRGVMTSAQIPADPPPEGTYAYELCEEHEAEAFRMRDQGHVRVPAIGGPGWDEYLKRNN
jgi:hypothetical protein